MQTNEAIAIALAALAVTQIKPLLTRPKALDCVSLRGWFTRGVKGKPAVPPAAPPIEKVLDDGIHYLHLDYSLSRAEATKGSPCVTLEDGRTGGRFRSLNLGVEEDFLVAEVLLAWVQHAHPLAEGYITIPGVIRMARRHGLRIRSLTRKGALVGFAVTRLGG